MFFALPGFGLSLFGFRGFRVRAFQADVSWSSGSWV